MILTEVDARALCQYKLVSFLVKLPFILKANSWGWLWLQFCCRLQMVSSFNGRVPCAQNNKKLYHASLDEKHFLIHISKAFSATFPLLLCSIWANCSVQNVNKEINHHSAELSLVSRWCIHVCLAFAAIYILTNTVYRCWAVSFWHGSWALNRHSKMMINGCSCFIRQVKKHNHALCLPTHCWLTGYACQKVWWRKTLPHGNIETIKIKAEILADIEEPWIKGRIVINNELKWNSPGMSVRLCCWRQNGGVSGRGPGNSHVYPAEMISEVKGWKSNLLSQKVGDALLCSLAVTLAGLC